MNILYIITRSDALGGASAHLLDLAKGAQDRGHDITIVIGGQGVVVELARKEGLRCVSLPSLVREFDFQKDLKSFFRIRALMRQINPDLVHLHSSKAGFLGRVAAFSLRLPCVYTAHGWSFTDGVSRNKQLIYRFLERIISVITSHIITVSEYDRRIGLMARVGREANTTVVHNGVASLPPQKKVVVGSGVVKKLIMVARFEDQKDHDLVVSALHRLREFQWVMEFVGDGPRKSFLEDRVRRLGLSDRITFSGARDDVPSRLANSDIFVLASHWEGFPLVILEAMRASLPVVASDVGGVRESVSQNITGLLVPRACEDEMVAALNCLLNDSRLRCEMGNEGRRHYEMYFTLDTMIDKTLMVYDRVLG